MAATYFQLLRHPLWRQRRDEIIARTEGACENCHAVDVPLEVHHAYYERGLKPWEYPDESLHPLCRSCHVSSQDLMTLLHRQIGQLEIWEMDELLGCAAAMQGLREPDRPFEVPSGEFARGFGRYLGFDGLLVTSTTRYGVTTVNAVRKHAHELLYGPSEPSSEPDQDDDEVMG